MDAVTGRAGEAAQTEANASEARPFEELPYPDRRRPTASSRLSVSVVVPVHNGGEAFRRCLVSLTTANPRPAAMIVVEDGAADGSRQMAERFGARVISMPERRGPAAARNAGARSVRAGDIVLFVDADVMIPSDAIGRVEANFRATPAIAALFGSYDDAPDQLNFVSQYKNLFHHYIHQTSQESASTFWAGFGAIRQDVLTRLGGFDEMYREPCIEDVELGYRLRERGFETRLCKDLQVKHLKRWTPLALIKTDFSSRALPWTALLYRYRGILSDLNLRPRYRVSAILLAATVLSGLASLTTPDLLALTAVLIVLLLVLNLPLYVFFARKRGFWFACRTLPWHWLYYFYSGVAFLIGTVLYLYQTIPGRSSVRIPVMQGPSAHPLMTGEMRGSDDAA